MVTEAPLGAFIFTLPSRDCMKGEETENKKIGCTVNLMVREPGLILLSGEVELRVGAVPRAVKCTWAWTRDLRFETCLS